MIRLTTLLKEILEEQTPSQLAKSMGLFSIGWGRWYNPKIRRITHLTRDGQLIPYESGSYRQVKRDGPVGKRVARSHQEFRDIAQELDPNWEHPAHRWNDPSNVTYGPAPENAPDIVREVEMGDYWDIPIRGVVQDLEIEHVTQMLPPEEGRNIAYDDRVNDDVYSTLSTGEQLGADIVYELAEWQEGGGSSKKRFIDKALELFPSRMNMNGPIMRGLSVNPAVFDEFMSDFEIGTSVTLPESYSFTTATHIATDFALPDGAPPPMQFDGEVFQEEYPVFIRLHPADDGLTSGVYIPRVHDMYESALQEMEREGTDTGETNNIRSNLRSQYYREHEFLTLPDVEYEVMGRAKLKLKNGAMGMIIDIKEKSRQTTEQGLPGRPTLPKPKAKSVNKIVQHYLDKPLNPNK
jgi:hypothetical protein